MARPKPTSTDIELRALDLFERLSAYPGHARFRARLLAREPTQVLARLARIEAGHAARAVMPTEAIDTRAGSSVEAPGRIGPFRLTARIGQGGMGDVWRGERDDGLFEQTVAIKLIRAHLGDEARRAFDAERRILARLDHPDIVRLTDGGVTPEGLPYLIMDFVNGAPFDEAVAPLALASRVAVFQQAARAVQFAHGRLVAHADLKPFNILVDSDGRVRLLDFGVAGLLTGERDAAAVAGAMTREFASPQRLAGAEPSIADDVFALGRILIGVIAGGADGDLSAIAAQATAADEADRYGTVAALLADLDRWRTGKPVLARGDTFPYRAGKFIKRNKVGVAASTLAVLALLVATGAATLASIRAERARAEATARFDDARGAARYLLFTLMDRLEARPRTLALRGEVADVAQHYLDRLSRGPGAPDAVRLEAARGLIRLAQVRGVPGYRNLADPAAARGNLDRALAVLGDDGEATAPELKVTALIYRSRIESAADHAADRALATLARADAIAAADARISATVRGELLSEHAAARRWKNDFSGVIPKARAALAILPVSNDLDGLLERCKAMDLLAEGLFYAVGAKASLQPYRDTVTLLESTTRLYPNSPLAALRLAHARWALGSTLLSMDRYGEALALLSKTAFDLQGMVAFDPDDLEAARQLQVVRLDQAEALTDNHRVAEGLAMMKANIQARRDWLAKRPGEPRRLRDLAIGVEQLGGVETRHGRVAEGCGAYAEFRALLAQLARMGDIAQMDMADTLDDLATQERRYCPGSPATKRLRRGGREK